MNAQCGGAGAGQGATWQRVCLLENVVLVDVLEDADRLGVARVAPSPVCGRTRLLPGR